MPGSHQLEAARVARDPRFDGRFFIGVKTTGIYCRPVCRVKMPREENVTYFRTAAEAGEAGFRPCLRCRPEAAPGTPAWLGTTTTVNRAMRLIADGELDAGSVETLAARLGITSRYLSRLFSEQLGASPVAIAQTRRLQNAKRLLDETHLPVTEVAFAAGYGSPRRMNDHFQKVYGRSPSTIRKETRRHADDTGAFRLRLQYRPPYDYDGLLNFLAVRATPGVESVSDGVFERAFRIGDTTGSVRVSHDPDGRSLNLCIRTGGAAAIMPVVNLVRSLFDVDADPRDINETLCADPVMKQLVDRNPGQRVAGCWDPFEIAVRAIVGQQISVKGATTVMGEIVRQYGGSLDDRSVFPSPAALAELDPASLPMPGKRAEAIKAMAAAVAGGDVDFSETPETVNEALLAIKGIGPWTADYIAMRALGNPDAFLSGDLILLRTAKALFKVADEKSLKAYAEAFRPWRAYAGAHIWRAAATVGD